MSDETRGNNNPKKQKLSGVGESNLLRKETFVSSTPAPLFDNMHRGYFPLWRKIRDWGWYKDVNTKSVFIELLLLSNFKENYYLGHKIQRGQCVAGRKTLSASLGLSERQIRTALKRLLATSEITIKNCNKFSIITLNNFDKYLPNDQRAVHQTTSKRPDIDQHMTTPYNDKNDKNDKNVNIDSSANAPTDSVFLDILKTNPAYKMIDIDIELKKMDAWLLARPGRKKTRRFIVNWLNKVDKPIEKTEGGTTWTKNSKTWAPSIAEEK